MKSSNSPFRRVAKDLSVALLACLLPALCSSFAASAQSQAPSVETPAAVTIRKDQPDARETWRRALLRIPRPKRGCFAASYPKLEWREVACTAAPNVPYQPKSDAVGGKTDYSASVSNLLTMAEGGFGTSRVTSETGYAHGQPPELSNTYSIQINTSPFVTTACSGAADPSSCKGWQQFLYTSAGTAAFMQYWLVKYATTCPDGWHTYKQDCYRNSPAVTVPTVPITSLSSTVLTGSVNASTDTPDFSVGSSVYSTSGDDSVLYLSNGWNTAEFNIFGDCCGSVANFNAGAILFVNMHVDNGSSNAPNCIMEGFTGESNNLTLTGESLVVLLTSLPGIVFAETNDPPYSAPTCYAFNAASSKASQAAEH